MTGDRAAAWRAVRAVLAAALTVPVLLLAGTDGPATADPVPADPLASAQAQATALRLSVDRLQVAAEVAVEHYDGIEEQLGQAVTTRLLALTRLQAAQAVVAERTATLDAQVRALYQSGGQLGLVAGVLDGSSIDDLASRDQDVAYILGAQQDAVHAASTAVAEATTVERALSALTARRTRLQVAAAAATAQIRALLAGQQALLASATATVRRLATAQEAAAVRAAEAQAAAELAAARLRLGLPPLGPVQAPTRAAAIAVAAAESRVGDPYVYAATGPNAFDCSGLVQWSYRQAGVLLPRVAAEQYYAGVHVSLGQLEPGDLLFYAYDPANPATIHHVTMYVGHGLMIEAPYTGAFVHILPVYLNGFAGATRPT